MTTIFSLCYSQNGIEASTSIADFYSQQTAKRVCPSDCVVVPRTVTKEYAEANCED